VAQSHTPHDHCVRFVVVVTFHNATLVTRQALPLSRAGLSPAGPRQLRLAHRYSFIAVDLHHLLFAGFDRRTRNQDFRKLCSDRICRASLAKGNFHDLLNASHILACKMLICRDRGYSYRRLLNEDGFHQLPKGERRWRG